LERARAKSATKSSSSKLRSVRSTNAWSAALDWSLGLSRRSSVAAAVRGSADGVDQMRSLGIREQRYVNSHSVFRKWLTQSTFARFSDPQFQTRFSSNILGVSTSAESCSFLSESSASTKRRGTALQTAIRASRRKPRGLERWDFVHTLNGCSVRVYVPLCRNTQSQHKRCRPDYWLGR